MKDWACFLFLDPQNEIGPSISSSVVPCSFVILVYIVTLVLVFCLCPSSVRVVATFPGTVFISFTIFCAPVCSLIHWFFSLSSFVIPSKCLKNFICAASKRRSSLFFSTQASLPNFSAAHPYRKACRSRGMKVAAPPLDSPCDGPVTYPGYIKTLIKSSKGRSGPTLHMTTRLGLTDKKEFPLNISQNTVSFVAHFYRFLTASKNAASWPTAVFIIYTNYYLLFITSCLRYSIFI